MIYVAAPLSCASIADALADTLRRHGFTVVSTWHAVLKDDARSDPVDAGVRQEALDGNVAELDRARLVVAWTAAGTPKATIGEIVWALRGGYHVVWVQGPNRSGSNLWDAHQLVTVVRSVDEGEILAAVRKAMARTEAAA